MVYRRVITALTNAIVSNRDVMSAPGKEEYAAKHLALEYEMAHKEETIALAKEHDPVAVLYRNHRGEAAVRRIGPIKVWFGSTPWHRSEDGQWLLDCWDFDKEALRTFALADCSFRTGNMRP